MITAIVAARGGSVRLPCKALLPFAGSSLVGHKVRTLKACPLIDRVVINSDSEAIRREACLHGAEAIEGRDYHDDTRMMLSDSAAQVGGRDEDLILWAHPTNPLVRADTYASAIAAYRSAGQDFDSLLSVVPVQRHAWMSGRPFNYDPYGDRHTLAADLEPIGFQDGAIFIRPRGAMRDDAYFFGRRPLLFEMNALEGWDIDTEQDYRAARALFEIT
jgi:CMP-N,N'-diacetyllegionaminic acid synthase